MGLPIVISEIALLTFEDICEQIFQRLGNKARDDFKKNTIKTLELISSSPFIYKESDFDKNIRIGLIKKTSSVFYEIKPNQIDILFFWDNRQEPMSL